MILKKLGDEYKLYSHDSCIATTQESPHKRLSKKNCDEIFGIIDVGALALEECNNTDPLRLDSQKYKQDPYFRIGYLKGFNKAMELNKDKLFTKEQVIEFTMSMISQYNQGNTNIWNRYLLDESLQQPTEIEVDIKMEPCYYDQSLGAFSTSYTEDKPVEQPKLDKDGCLILTKKK
jgi:hypothetical protein